MQKLICISCLIFVFLTCPGYAEDILPLSPVPEIRAIEPVPDIKPVLELKQQEEEKPQFNFTGMAIIDRIGDKDIVLDDNLYNLYPSTNFYSADGKPISRSKFRAGKRVAFVLSPDNSYDVLSLWEVK